MSEGNNGSAGNSVPEDNDSLENMRRKMISRRRALSKISLATIGVVGGLVIGGAAGYVGGGMGKAAKTVTQTGSTQTVTQTGVGSTVTQTVTGSFDPVAKAQSLATAKPGDKFMIGNITFSLTNEPGFLIDAGAKQAAQALGLDYVTNDIGTDVTTGAISAARTLISNGAKGIITYFIDPSAAMSIAQLCQQNKVFFSSTYAFAPPNYPWAVGDYYLRCGNQPLELDMYTVSSLLFQKLKQDLGNATLVHIQGSPNTAWSPTKDSGIWDAWQKYSNIQLTGHQYGNWDIAGGKTAASQAIAANPNVQGVVAVNDSMAVGGVEAGTAAGLNLGPYSVGIDGVQTAMQYIESGNLYLSNSFLPPYMGGLEVSMLYDVITGAYYPPDADRIWWSKGVTVAKDPASLTSFANSIGFDLPYPVASSADMLSQVYTGTSGTGFPWDWTLVSRGKASELSKTFDINGGTPWGGYRSTVNLMGGSGDTYSAYLNDRIKRFNNFTANTLTQANASPFAPGPDSINVNPYNAWIGVPATVTVSSTTT